MKMLMELHIDHPVSSADDHRSNKNSNNDNVHSLAVFSASELREISRTISLCNLPETEEIAAFYDKLFVETRLNIKREIQL